MPQERDCFCQQLLRLIERQYIRNVRVEVCHSWQLIFQWKMPTMSAAWIKFVCVPDWSSQKPVLGCMKSVFAGPAACGANKKSSWFQRMAFNPMDTVELIQSHATVEYLLPDNATTSRMVASTPFT
jgi:hypothetical protein